MTRRSALHASLQKWFSSCIPIRASKCPRWSSAIAPSPARTAASTGSRIGDGAYPIAKVHKAHYVLMNIEVVGTLDELEHAFKFNDAVLRHLIVAMDGPVLAPSPMMREEGGRSPGRRSVAEAIVAIGVTEVTGVTEAIAAIAASARPRPAAAAEAPVKRPSGARGHLLGHLIASPRHAEPRVRRRVHQLAHARRHPRPARRSSLYPAGIPALDCVLKHASVQAEAGSKRAVDCELAAVALAIRRRRWRRCRWARQCAARASSPGATAPASPLRCTSMNSKR